MDAPSRTRLVLELARKLGFVRAGVATAGPTGRMGQFDAFIAEGRSGEMAYLARYRELRADPRELLPGALSVIVVADSYRPTEPPSQSPAPPSPAPAGRVATYAWGRDYHVVLKRKLGRLVDSLREQLDEPFESRSCVDTAPIVEREWAAAAGVGWIGKNTLVLHESAGSYFFLGEILTTLDLEPTPPAMPRCGTCTRCLEACPTGALTSPHQMDARRCISYLTIEHRTDVPPDLAKRLSGWLYGCDLCQEVCPYNEHADPSPPDPAYAPLPHNPLVPAADTTTLAQLAEWSEEEYRHHLSGSAMKRARLDMLKRTAALLRRKP